jgi:hypothetical protein
MACSGTYCVNCTSNACAGKYRAARGGNPYSFPAIGSMPTASFTNHLKTALNQEISARNSKRSYGLTAVGFTDATAGTHFVAKTSTEVLTELKTRLNAIINSSMYKTALSKKTGQTTAGSYPSTGGDGLSSTTTLGDVYTAGTKITAAHWTNIRDKILSLMRECLCNGDCGSNYWCGCHNDCGCNYSDVNLKENVIEDGISLEKFNEVKSKSWNYSFDKEHKYFGPIAQDVEKIFPEAIREDGQGYKMLNQVSMIGILWGALNKSIDKISELESRLETLEKK